MQKAFIILIFFFINSFSASSEPGSGKSLLFTKNNYVGCGNPAGNLFDFAGDGTIEAWVKISTTPPPPDGVTCYSILAKDENPGEFNKWIFGVQNGKLAFHINSTDANHNWVYSNPFVLVLNKYYHFVMTKNSSDTVTFFINGNNMGSFLLPHATTVINSQMVIGHSETGMGMDGEIDEVRFWKKIVTQKELRDWMCQKINSSHPAYSNLVANYSLDEGSGSTTINYNNMIATLVNSPQWVTSAAPIGDLSAYDFVSTVKSANISNAYGENFAATISSGVPNGIIVYRVDEAPNTNSGINAIWNSNTYFGVFVAEVNPSSPAYLAAYSYIGNPSVNAFNECSIQLYKRKNNADIPWTTTNISPNLAADNISLNGESTEYILACPGTITPWPSSLKTGLVAYYPFNGNAYDQSGNGNNPDTVLGILTTDRYGNPNSAYHFNGSQYIMGSCSNLPETTRTVSFWYNADNFALNSNYVFGYGGGNCGNSWITIFAIPTFVVAGHCNNFGTVAGIPPPLNKYWHNLIISYDGSYIKIYVDGCLITSEYKGTITTTDVLNKSFYIGAIPDKFGVLPYIDPGNHWWIGDLDDLAIWNRALTDQEIKVVAQPVCQPEISISKNSGDTICINTPVIFTAKAINNLLTPNYQWKLNNTNVGPNSSTYSTNTVANGDIISCILLNATICSADTSNSIQMTVNANQPVSVIISSDDTDNTICSGASVTFTAALTNEGISPSYQWKVNGSNVGKNSSTYTTSSLADNTLVTCIVTPKIGSCSTGNPVTSNSIQVTVIAEQSLSVLISSDDVDNIICSGSLVTFTAAPINGGAMPSYLWKLNGNSVGTNKPEYINNSFADRDVVKCIVTSNAACVNSSSVSSNNVIIHVPAAVNLGKDTSLCILENINLNVPDTFLSYHWSTGVTSKGIKVSQPGTYWLQVHDQYGCISSDTINIKENCGFFIPNAFTPNSDGKNDLFKPVLPGNVIAYKFSIFNRWGIKVFETSNMMKGWDGSFKDVMQPSNAFIWICEFQLAGQPRVRKKGTLVLIK